MSNKHLQVRIGEHLHRVKNPSEHNICLLVPCWEGSFHSLAKCTNVCAVESTESGECHKTSLSLLCGTGASSDWIGRAPTVGKDESCSAMNYSPLAPHHHHHHHQLKRRNSKRFAKVCPSSSWFRKKVGHPSSHGTFWLPSCSSSQLPKQEKADVLQRLQNEIMFLFIWLRIVVWLHEWLSVSRFHPRLY